MRFANNFHSWLRHSWKLLANRFTRDPKIVIHGTHALFFISCIVCRKLTTYHNSPFCNYDLSILISVSYIHINLKYTCIIQMDPGLYFRLHKEGRCCLPLVYSVMGFLVYIRKRLQWYYKSSSAIKAINNIFQLTTSQHLIRKLFVTGKALPEHMMTEFTGIYA